MVKFLDLHKQYLTIKDEIDQAIADVIKSSAFIGGVFGIIEIHKTAVKNT